MYELTEKLVFDLEIFQQNEGHVFRAKFHSDSAKDKFYTLYVLKKLEHEIICMIDEMGIDRIQFPKALDD